MKGSTGIFAALVVVALSAAPLAPAAEQTRASYRAQVEPICKRDTLRSKRILNGVRGQIRRGRLHPAGKRFIRVSRAFGKARRQLARVPRPAGDLARLRRWFKFLRIVQKRMVILGKRLKAGNRVKATHASIALERSANAANNVGFVFGFRYCRLTRSRFG